jgi:hypothetical protein
MAYLGRIEAISESAEIDPTVWFKLIDAQGPLRHVPPVMGINPFTRQPCEVNAPSSTAQVCIDGVPVGTISWATDGSPCLLVDADDESVEYVARIAEDVATALGAHFVREMGED